MRTRADLVNRVAKFLGKKIAGESLGAVEYETIDDEVPSIIANLNSRGITYISNDEEIEDELFDPLARIIAAKVCTDFGMSIANLADFDGEPRPSEFELRALGRGATVFDVIRFNNF